MKIDFEVLLFLSYFGLAIYLTTGVYKVMAKSRDNSFKKGVQVFVWAPTAIVDKIAAMISPGGHFHKRDNCYGGPVQGEKQ